MVGKLSFVISSCSLEIYIPSFWWIDLLKDIFFPANVLALFISILIKRILSILFSYIIGIIVKR